jgi:signal transduction histidine kinase
VEGLYEQLRRSNYELDAARSRLLDYSKQIEKITKLEERNRISRELHDSIGHNLTGILLQVDAAKQVMEVDRDRGMEILESVYKTINTSIEAVRQTVREIRPSKYQTHKASILELINRFTMDTGVNVEYKTSGIPYELFPSIEMVLYRNIQEALTNSVRHGGATNILVHIIYKNECTEAVISDNGTGCKEIKKGLGISGMEERLEIIGGSIKYEIENGFSIHMYIPIRS